MKKVNWWKIITNYLISKALPAITKIYRQTWSNVKTLDAMDCEMYCQHKSTYFLKKWKKMSACDIQGIHSAMVQLIQWSACFVLGYTSFMVWFECKQTYIHKHPSVILDSKENWGKNWLMFNHTHAIKRRWDTTE